MRRNIMRTAALAVVLCFTLTAQTEADWVWVGKRVAGGKSVGRYMPFNDLMVLMQAWLSARGGTGPSQIGSDFAVSLAGGTITVQAGKMRFDTTPCDLGRRSISASGSGTGIAKLYIWNSCAMVLLYPTGLPITFTSDDGITAGAAVLPVFPSGSFPIADVVIRNGTIESITDLHRAISVDAHMAGPGLVIDCTTGACLFSTDPAVIPTLGGTNVFTGKNIVP